MSSLLDGIDVKDPNAAPPRRSGPDPKVIKITVAGVLLLAAGALVGMQLGLIPSPFGGGVTNSQGQVVTPTPLPAPTTAERERLDAAQQQFIERGGVIGDS